MQLLDRLGYNDRYYFAPSDSPCGVWKTVCNFYDALVQTKLTCILSLKNSVMLPSVLVFLQINGTQKQHALWQSKELKLFYTQVLWEVTNTYDKQLFHIVTIEIFLITMYSGSWF